jgi:hypothetical protein
MPAKRQECRELNLTTLPGEQVLSAVERVLHSRHFFLAPGLELEWETRTAETIPWEIFHGRLLPPAQTRLERAFLAWNVYLQEDGQRSTEPLLSLKLDREAQRIFVVRGLLSYVWEGYQGEGNVYLSREVSKWVSELVGTVDLTDFAEERALVQELASRLFHAVVGLSRLPLTSVEAPLPGFSLGKLGYFCRADQADAEPMRSATELLERGFSAELSWAEQVKLVELVLRSVPPGQGRDVVPRFLSRWTEMGRSPADLTRLLRSVVNDISLSPYTHFVDNLLSFGNELVASQFWPVAEQVDFYSTILRQLVRHLTAYDLVNFHNRGANYPDALFLDAVLQEYLRLIEQEPALFSGDDSISRRRRRALRQAWLVRQAYTGHPVPDAPTSPGENARVLPEPFRRVPEEQLVQITKRRRILYDREPAESLLTGQSGAAFNKSIEDLQCPEELQELGMAVFIDRPLGAGKFPGEPDQTLLFSHVAFSRSVALSRLDFLHRKLADPAGVDWQSLRAALSGLNLPGVPARDYRGEPRRVVSLADAAAAADDFILVRTTAATVRAFLDQYRVAEMEAMKPCLIVPAARQNPAEPRLRIYDDQMQPRLELAVDLSQGYISCDGKEIPAAGLRLIRPLPKKN